MPGRSDRKASDDEASFLTRGIFVDRIDVCGGYACSCNPDLSLQGGCRHATTLSRRMQALSCCSFGGGEINTQRHKGPVQTPRVPPGHDVVVSINAPPRV